MVKVWIKTDQVNKISNGGSPDRYWTSVPLQESGIVEMNISIGEFSKWQQSIKKESGSVTNFGKKQLLND